MRTGIYAIYDTVGEAIVGGLHLHKHEAAATRFYNDVMGTRDTVVGQHPEDYDLLFLGTLEDDEEQMLSGAVPTRTVLSGKQWVAIHAAQASKLAASTAQNDAGSPNRVREMVREGK